MDLILLPVYFVAINMAAAILLVTALDFLGVGIAPPTPSWGSMLSDAMQYLSQSPDVIVYPGLMITAAVFCLNLIAGRIRDTFDFVPG